MPWDAERQLIPGALLACAATVTSLLLLLRPVLAQPTLLLGSADSEAPAHVHWLAAALSGLGAHGPFQLSATPTGLDASDALMDPASVLLMAPISALAGGGIEGFGLAWNALPALGLLASALGAWIWARAWLGDEDPGAWGAGTAAALAASSLWALHQLEVGRSECFLYPAYALHGGLLFAALRHGGWQRWLGAGLSLLLVTWCGLSTVPLLLLLEAAVLAWALPKAPSLRRAIAGLAALGAVGVGACLPMLWALRTHPPPSMANIDARVPGPAARLEALVGGQGDLLQGLPGYEVMPWLGWALVVGAVLAALRWRQARLPALLAAVLLSICAGPHPTLSDVGLVGPAALFEALPAPVGLVRGWVRMMGMLVPFVAVLAAAAVVRRPWLAVGLVVLGIGEAALRAPKARSTMSLAPPRFAEQIQGRGEAALELPRDRLALARRALLGPSDPDPWDPRLDQALMVLLDASVSNLPQQFDREPEQPVYDGELGDLRRRASKLRKLGVHGLLLRDHSLVPGAEDRARALLDVIACPPSAAIPGYWSLPVGHGQECLAPTHERRRRSLGDPLE